MLSNIIHRPARPAPALLDSDDNPAWGEDDTLEDAARYERDYVRERLRGELGRDPTEQELDEWLRDHTEGY